MKAFLKTGVDAQTRLMGIVGEGLAHTKSPVMHNHAAALLGVNAVYLPVSLPEERLAGFLKAAWDMGALGFNVTTPHKEAVARLIDSPGLASVNTVYRHHDAWFGASTDGPGFAAGLGRLGYALEEFSHYVFLGGGGAVIALCEHLGRLGVANKELTVVRRLSQKVQDRDQALQRAAPATCQLKLRDWSLAELQETLSGCGAETLLVQATSAPLHGDDLKSFVPALETFQGVLVDLVYGNPSALYFAAIARGLDAQDGEAMLIEQARLSQELWWGKAAAFEDLAAALRGKHVV